MAKISELTPIVGSIQDKVDKAIKKKYKIKKFDETQTALARNLVSSIISNEPREEWEAKVPEYVNDPKDYREEVAREIDNICFDFDVDEYQAAILRLAKTESPE